MLHSSWMQERCGVHVDAHPAGLSVCPCMTPCLPLLVLLGLRQCRLPVGPQTGSHLLSSPSLCVRAACGGLRHERACPVSVPPPPCVVSMASVLAGCPGRGGEGAAFLTPCPPPLWLSWHLCYVVTGLYTRPICSPCPRLFAARPRDATSFLSFPLWKTPPPVIGR